MTNAPQNAAQQSQGSPQTSHAVAPHALMLSGVTQSYVTGDDRLDVLKGVDLTIQAGEIVALVAPSGAGKSTLLHIAGLLERPATGKVSIGNQSCHDQSDDRRTAIRRTEIGFVYQFHHLLPEFTALENVVMPQIIRGLKQAEATDRARQLLKYMRIDHRANHRPAELSGGEQQRVAIARAVANVPRLLLADEPTGNLDPKTSAYVFDALLALVRGSRLGALIATHNHNLARRMDRCITLHEGRAVDIRL